MSATRMTREARGGYSCSGEVTVSGNRVRAGASGTRRRSVTRPTDPLTRLALSPSRSRCTPLLSPSPPSSPPPPPPPPPPPQPQPQPTRRPSSSEQVPAHREPLRLAARFACSRSNGPALRQRDYAITRARSWIRPLFFTRYKRARR